MFKANNQPALITFETELSEKQRKSLDGTKEKWFYSLIFSNINEHDFKPLYSTTKSRPNVPVNILVSALILKELRGISFNELFESIMFDLRMKVALGLENIDDVPFSMATIFNFQNRLLAYEQETGINLIEKVFDGLSASQIKQLSLKADIQRTDSTLVSSNIKKYSRIQLLIEILLRVFRILDNKDKELFSEKLSAYTKEGSQKYVYKLKAKDISHELNEIGGLYQLIHNEINKSEKYTGRKEYIVFERVYKEHFIVLDNKIEIRANEDLHSGMLQSPDDQDATYRNKRGEESKGFVVNATETANPENPVQLLTDIAVAANNVDDSKILNERLDGLKEKTPDLKEMHTDGGYGSKENDEKFEKAKITQVTTAVRGRESKVELKIEQVTDNPQTYTVECPNQKVESIPTKQRNKVRFDTKICEACPLKNDCPANRNKGRFYFKHEDYLQNKRNRTIKDIPPERRKIRPNVEATMKEIKTRTNAGKLKVRGLFKTKLFALNVGIAINFGRIYRYLIKVDGITGPGSENIALNLLSNGKIFIFWTEKVVNALIFSIFAYLFKVDVKYAIIQTVKY